MIIPADDKNYPLLYTIMLQIDLIYVCQKFTKMCVGNHGMFKTGMIHARPSCECWL